MEEMENEYEKGIYWVIFFIILAFLAFLGYEFVFNNKKTNEDEGTSEEVVQESYDSYKGIWQLFGDEDLPEYELAINIIDGVTITFDFGIKDSNYFESQTASLEDDTARFEIVSEDNDKLIGKIILKNNKVFLTITSSSFDNITAGTIEFSEKGEENLIK